MRQLYARIAKEVLPGWEISLAFVDARTARALNKKLRKKNYTPNVLSYQVGESHGEILICKDIARTQAPAYGLLPSAYFLLLFIHALLHLEGRAHGVTMERREQKLLAKFLPAGGRSGGRVPRALSFSNETTHRGRHRHRYVPGKTGRR